jgi:predicted O-methyltransferase YrrM
VPLVCLTFMQICNVTYLLPQICQTDASSVAAMVWSMPSASRPHERLDEGSAAAHLPPHRLRGADPDMLLSRRNQLRLSAAGVPNSLPIVPESLPLQMHPVEFGQVALAAVLKRPVRALEWGCGGTTVALLSLLPTLQTLVSVEHNVDWHTHVLQTIEDPRLQLLLCRPRVTEPQPDATMPAKKRAAVLKRFADQCEKHPSLLGDYVTRPGELFSSYDLILVDGLARRACLQRGYELLAPGGVMLLHDAHQPQYRATLSSFPEHRFLDPWVQGQLCMVTRPLP